MGTDECHRDSLKHHSTSTDCGEAECNASRVFMASPEIRTMVRLQKRQQGGTLATNKKLGEPWVSSAVMD